MSLINVTPSTGRREAVSINLNALKVKPGDRVVYWSPAAQAVTVDVIDAIASQDGNFFSIDGERIIVTAIYAKLPERFDDAQAEAIRADFASFCRDIITGFERLTVRDRHGLAS